MRVLQGILTGAIVVAKRAYFVDVYKGDTLQHYLSLFTIVWSVGPIVAPFLGGYLQWYLGWESNFYFLFVYAFLMFLLEAYYGGETLQKPARFALKSVVRIYFEMVRTVSFILGIVMLGLAYAMVMVYNMTGPFVLEYQYGKDPIWVGYASLVLGLAWMAGGFIGKATLQQPFYRKMTVNLALQICFSALLLWYSFAALNAFYLLAAAFLIHNSAGYTFNNYFSYCLGRFPDNAGIAGGLTGGITYIIVSWFSSGIVSLWPASGADSLAKSYFLLTLLSILVMAFILSKRRLAS